MGDVLQAIGYWRSPGNFFGLPHPGELANYHWPLDQKACLLGYLSAGVLIMRELSAPAHFFASKSDANGASHDILSDGIYYWPKTILYYLDSHNVRLPEFFVSHALSSPSYKPISRTAQFRFGKWYAWCNRVRSNRAFSLISMIVDRYKYSER